MKILGGKYKGRNFYMPAGIRPTQGILRAAIFDILGHDMGDLTLLELFAGSGALSLEAISRGLKEVVMVEHNDLAAKTIRENCQLLGIEMGGNYRLVHGDAFTTVKRLSDEGKRFDIVFFDPPYHLGLAKKTLKLLISRDILHPHSLVVAQFEKDDQVELPEGFKGITERRYGSSYLSIFQKVAI